MVDDIKQIVIGYVKSNTEAAIKMTIWTYAVSVVLSMLFGLAVLGWWVWPVEWNNIGYAHLESQFQQEIVTIVADLHAYSDNGQYTKIFLQRWNGHVLACDMARRETDLAERARLVSAASTVTVNGCP